MQNSFLYSLLFVTLFLFACQENSTSHDDEKENAIASILTPDSTAASFPLILERIKKIDETLVQQIPILALIPLDEEQQQAFQLAKQSKDFIENLYHEQSKVAYRNELFNVYKARPQEIPANFSKGKVYKLELYNYALNLTTTAMVDIVSNTIIQVQTLKGTQPDIPTYLKDLAIQIAIQSPEVINALGYKPGEQDALMANTKTALNETRCERSQHLCVAPTFTIKDKALWAIVDLTDHRLVGIRWTHTGPEQTAKRISEKRLKFDKIMECYCQKMTHLNKDNWDFDYVITTSDGLRISSVKYQEQLVITSAKIVDWHVSYSNTDGFGYSDAVGCPEFSQAAVVAISEPRVSDIMDGNQKIGFALEQNFSSEQWPQPCNYNYLQRFEFYADGRFRSACASLGRGCGNNGTYRPVMRFSFPDNDNTFSEWLSNSWKVWTTEQWKLQNENTTATPEGYRYKIENKRGQGFAIEPNHGQFNDGGRGDFPYLYVTKLHADKDEGENDLVTIGPCCNTDYQQGPEKFIEQEPIENSNIVLWYVCQMKNDDRKGNEYCWSESYLEHGVYKTKVYPCLGGPMFVPLKKQNLP
ncbi:MAG: hypothetical protein R2831_09950 [Chitinophagaceae bacterium]